MGRRQLIDPYKALDNVDISVSQTQSPETTIDQIDKLSILIEWTGVVPVGQILVEVSYRYPSSGIYSAWQALDFGSTIDISGAIGTHVVVIQDPPFQKLRVRYARTSGTGNLTATLFASGKGA